MVAILTSTGNPHGVVNGSDGDQSQVVLVPTPTPPALRRRLYRHTTRPTGQFKQMVEAKNIQLLDSIGIGGWKGSLLLSWRGAHKDKQGQSWALVEGLETAPLDLPMTPPPPAARNLSLGPAMPVPDLNASVRPSPDLMWDEWA
jgi:hypothetical protein